jgi:hypothetical protein
LQPDCIVRAFANEKSISHAQGFHQFTDNLRLAQHRQLIIKQISWPAFDICQIQPAYWAKLRQIGLRLSIKSDAPMLSGGSAAVLFDLASPLGQNRPIKPLKLHLGNKSPASPVYSPGRYSPSNHGAAKWIRTILGIRYPTGCQ